MIASKVNRSSVFVMPPRISVIVGTYNRAVMLGRLLGSLLAQTLPADQYEVIVVDNGSTDGTRNVVDEYMHSNNTVRYVYEPELGVSRARNRGVKEARADVVAFIDDDAKASKDWLEVAVRCFVQIIPMPLAIGGPILPLYESVKPRWFKDKYEIRSWGSVGHFLSEGRSFSGSNMVLSKMVLMGGGAFEETLGPRGDALAFGEETALFQGLWRLHPGAQILYYCPELRVFHSVPGFKMTVPYHMKRKFASGQAQYGLAEHSNRLRMIAVNLWILLKSAAVALKHLPKHRLWQNWVFEELGPVFARLGFVFASLGVHIGFVRPG